MNFGHVTPSFMIIGTQKGGTSSLFFYLSQHPRLIVPSEKELHFFDTLKPTPRDEYIKLFPKHYFSKKMSFEATPRYLYFPGTAEKIYEFNPDMKFVVILRDPAQRAFSAWNMYRQMKDTQKQVEIFKERNTDRTKLYSLFYEGREEFPSFEECINIELSSDFDKHILEPSLIKRGYYKEQIEEYFKYFSRDKFLFIEFKYFKKDIFDTLTTITEFLRIPQFNSTNINLEPQNKRSYTETLSDELYSKLIKHFRKENTGLEDLIGMKLPWLHPKK